MKKSQKILAALISCSDCRQNLTLSSEVLACEACGSSYHPKEGFFQRVGLETQFFALPEVYDRFYASVYSGWDHHGILINALLEQLTSQRRICLDLGMGTGQFTRLLAERFEAVLGVDLDAGFLSHFASTTSYDNVLLLMDDLKNVALQPESVDLVFCSAFFPGQDSLQKMASWIAPGGSLCVVYDLAYCSQDSFERFVWADYLNQVGLPSENYSIAQDKKQAGYFFAHIEDFFVQSGFQKMVISPTELHEQIQMTVAQQFEQLAKNPFSVDHSMHQSVFNKLKKTYQDKMAQSYTRIKQREALVLTRE